MSDFTFLPVQINKGRKFKGFAYFLDDRSYFIGYAKSGVFPRTEVITAKLWDPASKKIVYANANFCEDVTQDAAKTEADRKLYIDTTIQSTIDWCRSKKPSAADDEIKRFARNVLRKNHPEMMDEINIAAPDNRNVADEIKRTLDWAMSLKTRPCYMYGKECKGGKDYPMSTKVKKAFYALENKGVTKLEGFYEAWELMLTIYNLTKYNKYFPAKNTEEQ